MEFDLNFGGFLGVFYGKLFLGKIVLTSLEKNWKIAPKFCLEFFEKSSRKALKKLSKSSKELSEKARIGNTKKLG